MALFKKDDNSSSIQTAGRLGARLSRSAVWGDVWLIGKSFKDLCLSTGEYSVFKVGASKRCIPFEDKKRLGFERGALKGLCSVRFVESPANLFGRWSDR